MAVNPGKKGVLHGWGTSESVKTGGDQIEYEDEDPRIRQMFDELAKRGVQSQMNGVFKTAMGV
jgi:hypothetical protein